MNHFVPSPPNKEALLNISKDLSLAVPLAVDIDCLKDPITFGAWSTANRFVALPMEGCDSLPDGSPSGFTYRRYRRIAAGGYGIVWFEAVAVNETGRSSAQALWLHEKNLPLFADLVQAMRDAAAKDGCGKIICILQLTHAGRYARPDGKPLPVMTHRIPTLDQIQGFPSHFPLVEDSELDALQDDFLRTAQLAIKAGFDGVDVKCCHGYLVSSLLGAHKREGRYGGSFANRTRFLLETTQKIRDNLPEALLATRMNVWDGLNFPYGWGTSQANPQGPDLDEPKKLALELRKAGIDLFGITLGLPRIDPQLNRPSSQYMGTTQEHEHPLKGVSRFLGILEEMQSTLSDRPVVLAGLTWLGKNIPLVAAGMMERNSRFLLGLGRTIYANPNAPKQMIQGNNPKPLCTTCSKCSFLMKHSKPAGCVVHDASVYLPAYKQLVKEGKTFLPHKEKAVALFINDNSTMINTVYGEGRKESLGAMVALHPETLSKTELLGRKEEFKNLQYIFSTWGMPCFTEEELAGFPRLKAVFYAAGSVKSFATPFLRRNIKVISAWEMNAQPVAAFVTAQILLAAKGYFRNTEDSSHPQKRSEGKCHTGQGIFRAKVALLGFGKIARRVCTLLQQHEMDILVVDPFLSEKEAFRLGIQKIDLDAAFENALIISNHLPDLPETKGMISGKHFRMMRTNGIFINTGRGAQVQEEEMIEVLSKRSDLSAFLDVTFPEPPDPSSDLYRLSNIRMTSHIAGSIGSEVVRMADCVIEELKRMESGGDLLYSITAEQLDKMA